MRIVSVRKHSGCRRSGSDHVARADSDILRGPDDSKKKAWARNSETVVSLGMARTTRQPPCDERRNTGMVSCSTAVSCDPKIVSR